MKAVRSTFQIVILSILLTIAVGCGPAVPATPVTVVPTADVKVTKITENDPVYNQITQIKTIDQCASASPLKAQIQFSESSGTAKQKELILAASMTVGGDLSEVAKIELEGSIQQHFTSTEQTDKAHQESLNIEVPAHTHQTYTIVWQETRREGTVEYFENGVAKSADYNYRVGLELASTKVEDIPCPTATGPTSAPDAPPPSASPTSPPPKPIAQGCISSQNWVPVSSDSTLLNTTQRNPDDCYGLEALGMYADQAGILHINLKEQRKAIASGIYTPINDGAVIEFKVFVNSMYLVYSDNPLMIRFAVASADKPMGTKNTARFNLLVTNVGDSPWIYFAMADLDETTGVIVSTQHYEYGHTYTIRFELEGNVMKTFINNREMNDKLFVPTGQKVFYIGYDLPLLSGSDVEIKDIRINTQFR